MTMHLAAGMLETGLIVAGIALHLGGCGICCKAAQIAARHRFPTDERNGWIACAVAFAGLAVVRLFGAEQIARQLLRSKLVLAGEYDQRWALQSTLAAAVFIAVIVLFALFLWRKMRHRRTGRTRLLLTAQLALLGYVPLLALRVLSWHQTDRLLYEGPVRLNWILEFVLALTAMIMAALYVRLVRQRTTERGRHG